MPALEIRWVDVFTDHPFAGNPLAIVPDADELDDDQMQLLARELGLSETVFVLDDLRRLRIFTPATELPLAGHPVVGTTVELGRVGRLADGVHVFETGVGHTEVELRAGIGTMVQPDLTVHRELDPEGCAALLGVEEHDVIGSPVVCETAVPMAFAQLRDHATLSGVHPDLDGIERIEGAIGLAAWCEDGDEVVQRFFGPGVGIAEDPATGAAAGALGALRVRNGAAPGPVTIRQGAEIGRPSTIHVEIGGLPGSPSGVRVGGTAVPVLEARIEL